MVIDFRILGLGIPLVKTGQIIPFQDSKIFVIPRIRISEDPGARGSDWVLM